MPKGDDTKILRLGDFGKLRNYNNEILDIPCSNKKDGSVLLEFDGFRQTTRCLLILTQCSFDYNEWKQCNQVVS